MESISYDTLKACTGDDAVRVDPVHGLIDVKTGKPYSHLHPTEVGEDEVEEKQLPVVDEEAEDDIAVMKSLVENESIQFTTLSNGKRAALDAKSGEILFVEEDSDDDSEDDMPVLVESDDDGDDHFEDPGPDPSPEKRPLVLELHKDQTPKAIEAMILRASQTLQEKGEQVSMVQVTIEGFSNDFNPALHRPAKKRYAKACEMGLLGLLHTFGFKNELVTIYATAYQKAKLKGGEVVARGLTTQAAQVEFAQRVTKSLQVYQDLLKRHSSK